MSRPHPSSRGTLRIGQAVREERSIDKVEWKKGMIFIHQKRVVSGVETGEIGLEEVRTHVFRPPMSTPISQADVRPDPSPARVPDISFSYTPTPPLLFRYSALTFNAHRIHYDRVHTLSIEQQPDLLVHGPLNATLLMDLAAREGDIQSFTYRAVSPVVVDREVQLLGWFSDKRDALELQAVQDGRIGMRATAQLHR